MPTLFIHKGLYGGAYGSDDEDFALFAEEDLIAEEAFLDSLTLGEALEEETISAEFDLLPPANAFIPPPEEVPETAEEAALVGAAEVKAKKRTKPELTPSIAAVETALKKKSKKVAFKTRQTYLDGELKPVKEARKGRRYRVYGFKSEGLSATKIADMYRLVLRLTKKAGIVSSDQIKRMRDKAQRSRQQIENKYQRDLHAAAALPNEKVKICVPTGQIVGSWGDPNPGKRSGKDYVYIPGRVLSKHHAYPGYTVGGVSKDIAKKIQDKRNDKTDLNPFGKRSIFQNKNSNKYHICPPGTSYTTMSLREHAALIAKLERDKAMVANRAENKKKIKAAHRLLMKSAREKGLVRLTAGKKSAGTLGVMIFMPESRHRDETMEKKTGKKKKKSGKKRGEEAVMGAIIDSESIENDLMLLELDGMAEDEMGGGEGFLADADPKMLVAGAAGVALLGWLLLRKK